MADFRGIVNLKYIAVQYLAMAILLLSFVNGENEPKWPSDNPFLNRTFEEVVSIYNNNFTTPPSRGPYFIKVQRCIIYCDNAMPIAIKKDEIEIVVADTNDNTKFYKYVVYNHTACGCGTNDRRKQVDELQKDTYYQINETEFKAKLPNNPANLKPCGPSSPFCSKPQPRHKLIFSNMDELLKIAPGNRFVLYYKCLPGCIATSTKVLKNATTNSGNSEISILIENDSNCKPYLPSTRQPSQKQQIPTTFASQANFKNPPSSLSLKTKKTQDSESDSAVLIYIASPKVFLAAFVLSVILVSILIVDFNLCHRKKGILYSVIGCRKDTKDTACPDCAERQKKLIEIV